MLRGEIVDAVEQAFFRLRQERVQLRQPLPPAVRLS